MSIEKNLIIDTESVTSRNGAGEPVSEAVTDFLRNSPTEYLGGRLDFPINEFLDFSSSAIDSNSRLINPQPGMCIKTKEVGNDNRKIFLNICHCNDIPKPCEDIMSGRYLQGDEDESLFRFPLSLGAPHHETDRDGKECICFDIIVNSEYFSCVLANVQCRSNLIVVSIQGIEEKYGISINENSCLKLNKRYHGTMPKHCIRKRREETAENLPVISLIGELSSVGTRDAPLLQAVETKVLKPQKEETTASTKLSLETPMQSGSEDWAERAKNNTISLPKPPHEPFVCISGDFDGEMKRPANQSILEVPVKSPKLYVLEAELPDYKIDSPAELEIYVSEKKIIIKEHVYRYYMDIHLTKSVVPCKSIANFYNGTIIVGMPLTGS